MMSGTSFIKTFVLAQFGALFFGLLSFSPVFADTIGQATTLIASGNFSGTTQDVTIPRGFSFIQVAANSYSFDTAARLLKLRISTDNGSTYISTNYTCDNRSDDRPTDGMLPIGNTQGSADVGTTTGILFGSDAGYPFMTSLHRSGGATDVNNVGSCGYMAATATTTITNIRFLLSGTGSFDAGNYKVIGYSATTTATAATSSSSTATSTSVYAPTQQEFLLLLWVVFFLGSIPFWERTFSVTKGAYDV